MRLRAALLGLLLAAPARADLDRAQRCLDHAEFSGGYREAVRCRAEDPQRSELLQMWALENMLRGDEARERLKAFRPDEAHARLFLIVHSMLDSANRRKDLEQAMQLSHSPAEQVDVLLRQFRAYPFPKDESYWQEAARIASEHKLPDELLVRLSLAHINLLCSHKRPQEGFAELALARRLMYNDPSRSWRLELARVELLNALDQPEAARAARLRLPGLAHDSVAAVTFLMRQVEARSENDRASSQRVLKQLEEIHSKAKDWSRPLDLYAFHLRSTLAQINQVGLEEWRRQADALCRSKEPNERLLGLADRGYVLMALADSKQALADLHQAKAMPPPRPGSEIYVNAQPAMLSLMLTQLEQSNKHYTEAQRWGQLCLEESGQNKTLALSAQLSLLWLYLRTAQMDRARQCLDDVLARAEAMDNPLARAIAYSQMMNVMLLASYESNRLLGDLLPFRVDPDTTAGWLFTDIQQNPQRQAIIFKALDELKEQSSHPSIRGVEGLFRGLILGSLDRPLEAMDAYADASQKSQSYGSVQANIGLIYAQELWGAGRREQALEVLRLAYEQARLGNVLAMPDSYGASYANALIRAGQKDKALPVIEHGLQTANPLNKPLFWLLRGRALDSASDVREGLKLAKQEATREEMLFELHRLEPEGHWLEQIKVRSPKQALHLMELSSPERALKIGHESLEQFRDTFEQLPTSARAAALRSPSLQALIEAILEASLKANQPQDGAHCLAVWRAMQSQPGPVSPELEQLRAELTGLRAANDPKLADRIADTRAQFLLKLNQLRQLNPDMERSLSAQVSELLALQPQLDAQTLLVQYYLAPDGLYLQALTHDQQQLVKVKIEKGRLLEHLQNWTAALRRPRPFTSDERTASRQLYAHLIEPLETLRQGHPNLWIMPSAELWDLPFETLLDAGDHYLLESAGCAYLGPSEAMQLSRPPASGAGRWVGASNARLPGTLEEIGQLKSLFSDAQVTQSWEELKKLASEARILHLATHSQAKPDQATEGYLEMAEGPIALDQIYGLSLPEGSLVVLSSCSGAVPQAHRERDLISLSSGFRAAGASSVVAALWPIDDQATVPFFRPMYQGLLKGQSRLQALRQAKLALVGQHPYYWAGFTLLGDPR